MKPPASTRVLLTAFEPFAHWQTNSSALCLEALAGSWPPTIDLTTRIYPVEFASIRERLEADLAIKPDFALHLGQAAHSSDVALEAIGLNLHREPHEDPGDLRPLLKGGPTSYRSNLPLARCAQILRAAGIPARVSTSAGSYLCNATLYWSRHWSATTGAGTRSMFVHLPIDPSQLQTLGGTENSPHAPTLPTSTCALAVKLLLEELARLTTTRTGAGPAPSE